MKKGIGNRELGRQGGRLGGQGRISPLSPIPWGTPRSLISLLNW